MAGQGMMSGAIVGGGVLLVVLAVLATRRLAARRRGVILHDSRARSEARIATLHASIAERALALIDAAERARIPIEVTDAYRSPEEQDRLYGQGRSHPGSVVTWARGGESWHNFGLAFDVAMLEANGRPAWPSAPGPWSRIGDLGEALGLAWGGRWPAPKTDRPHFEYHPGIQLADARAGARPPVARAREAPTP